MLLIRYLSCSRPLSNISTFCTQLIQYLLVNMLYLRCLEATIDDANLIVHLLLLAGNKYNIYYPE